MVRVDGEGELRLGRPGQATEELVGRLDHGAAHLTDEMAVGRRGEVVRGRAVAKMGVDDDAKAFELFEVPVDRRQVDIGGLVLHLGRQLLGGPMSAGGEQGPQ